VDNDYTNLYTFTNMPPQDFTLYAKWQPIEYDIIYDLNEGTNHSDNPQTYTINSDINLFSPFKEGHTFVGWYESDDYSGESVKSIVTGSTGDITLYAKWHVNQYTITYNIYENYDTFMSFPLFEGEKIVAISTVAFHNLLLTSKGRVITWGWNGFGELGDGTTFNRSVPQDVTDNFDLNEGERIIQAVAGYDTSSAFTSEGRVFTWGSNVVGQLGDGTWNDSHKPIDISHQFDLQEDETLTNLYWGLWHSVATTSTGRVFAWGANDYGQLGDGSTRAKNSPTEITYQFSLDTEEEIITFSLGGSHSAALTSTGRLFTWGINSEGQLGDDSMVDHHKPMDITSQLGLSNDEKIENVSLGWDFSIAYTSEGRIFTWGRNRYGQLGDGSTDDRYAPVDVTEQFELLDSEEIVSLSAGRSAAYAITSENRLFTWGWNSSGQLGDGTTTNRNEPVVVTDEFNLNDDETISDLAFGDRHTLLLTSENRLFTWGWNNYGQLGDGTTHDRVTPKPITFKNPNHFEVETYDFGSPITISELEREGYTFDGWYEDPYFTSYFSINKMPANNIVLYGKWLEIK